MKKLLSLLSVLTITGTAMPNVIAVKPYEKQNLNTEIENYYKIGEQNLENKLNNYHKLNKQKREISNYFINNIIVKLLDINTDNYLQILDSDEIKEIINDSSKLVYFYNSLIEIYNLLLVKLKKQEDISIDYFNYKTNNINFFLKNRDKKIEFEELDTLFKKIWEEFENSKNEHWLKVKELKERMEYIENWLINKNLIIKLNKKYTNNEINNSINLEKIKSIIDINFSLFNKSDLKKIISKFKSYKNFIKQICKEKSLPHFYNYSSVSSNFNTWSNYIFGTIFSINYDNNNNYNIQKTLSEDFNYNLNSVEKIGIFLSALENYYFILNELLKNDLNNLTDNFSKKIDEIEQDFKNKIEKIEKNKLPFKKQKINKIIKEKEEYINIINNKFLKDKVDIKDKFIELDKQYFLIKKVVEHKKNSDNSDNKNKLFTEAGVIFINHNNSSIKKSNELINNKKNIEKLNSINNPLPHVSEFFLPDIDSITDSDQITSILDNFFEIVKKQKRTENWINTQRERVQKFINDYIKKYSNKTKLEQDLKDKEIDSLTLNKNKLTHDELK